LLLATAEEFMILLPEAVPAHQDRIGTEFHALLFVTVVEFMTLLQKIVSVRLDQTGTEFHA
jgi:hypothetical protein